MPNKPYLFRHIKPYFTPCTPKHYQAISHITNSRDEWLDIFYTVISKKGIKLILLYGTCLGIVRDKKIINDDTDADYGIFIEDLHALHKCVPELLEKGIYISGRGVFQLTFSLPNTDFYIDIWPIKKVKNIALKLWGIKWLCDHVYYRQDLFSYLQKVEYHSKIYYTPHPAENYLEYVYGHNWKTPIKGHFSGARGKISQWITKCFVDFPVPLPFSGDNSLGTYKPWVSKILTRYFPNSTIHALFKHPEK